MLRTQAGRKEHDPVLQNAGMFSSSDRPIGPEGRKQSVLRRNISVQRLHANHLMFNGITARPHLFYYQLVISHLQKQSRGHYKTGPG